MNKSELLGRLLPFDRLDDADWLQALAADYHAAKPFAHTCIDDFFDPEVLDQVSMEFPRATDLGVSFQNEREVKRATKTEREIPPFARAFIHALNSAPFIDFVERVTGISGLVGDPHLVGGGFHALERGGKLSIHTDFNFHTQLGLDRRVNILVYLNKGWREEFGGHFEAWTDGGEAAEAKYLPVFNRLIIFATTDYTFHGNPDPVMCPEGDVRKSVAMYYYSNGRPRSEWRGVAQTTRFINRPGESVAGSEPMRQRILLTLPRPFREWVTRSVQRNRQLARSDR